MSAEVGGQLEAVPVRRSLFAPDYARLLVLVLIATAIHAWLVAHTAVPARDSLGYARIALDISDPNATGNSGEPRQRMDVVRTATQPPGYPMAVWFTEKALRSVTTLALAERSLLATQLANAIAAILLVVPMYLTGRILFGRNVGFAGALLFQVLPVPARVTSDGLSEGVYLLVVTVAVMLGVRAARRPTVGGFILCGLATGASYLVRPEGLLVAIAVGLVIIVAGMSRRWQRDLALGRLVALGVGVALVALPYMVLIGKITNKPTGDVILNPLDQQTPLLWKGQPTGKTPKAGNTPLFAAWWDPTKDTGRVRTLWAFEAVGTEVLKSLHYVIGGFALFALFAHRRQLFAPDAGLWVLLALGALNLTLLVYLAASIGYVSERHTVLFVMLACVLAAAALEPLAQAIGSIPKVGWLLGPKFGPAGLLLALVVAALPYTIKPMHPHREGHRHAGQWLAANMAQDDWLVDPFSWGEWYAGRTLYRPPVYHGNPAVTWTIIETGKASPHSRLPQWDLANELALHGECVYRWPAEASPDAFSVAVYKVKNTPPPKPKKPAVPAAGG